VRERAAGGAGAEVEAPATQRAGRGGAGLAVKGDFDGLRWSGHAPDVDGQIALDDHVAAENFWQANLCGHGKGQAGNEDGKKKR